MSDEKPDQTERMRRRYGSMLLAEMAFAEDLAHAFEGEGPLCQACLRGPGHPFHEQAEPEEGE